MSSAICPKCSRPVPSGAVICSDCFPQAVRDESLKEKCASGKGQYQYPEFKPIRDESLSGKCAVLWVQFLGCLTLIAVICGIAAVFCLITGSHRATTASLALISFFTWTAKGMLSRPSATEEKNTSQGWWEKLLPWPVIFMFLASNHWRNQDKLQKAELEKRLQSTAFRKYPGRRLDGPGGILGPQPFAPSAEQKLRRAESIALATERYWAAFSMVMDSEMERTPSFNADWFERSIAHDRARVVKIRQIRRELVDADLLTAADGMGSSMEAVLTLMEKNKDLVVKLNQGRDLSDPSAEADSIERVIALCQSLPPDNLPPELADFRAIMLGIKEASDLVDEVQIRLSERYKGRNFDWPTE